jgi:HYR domain
MRARGLPGFVVKRWVACIPIFLLALAPLAAQTIVFSGVASNVTVQCLSKIPSTAFGFTGVIPFALFGAESDTNLAAGNVISITRQSAPTGNPGKLDESSCEGGSWNEQMVDGVPCQVSVGDLVADIPGYTGIAQAFQGRLAANPIVIMPVVSTSGGSHIETVVGFVNAQILSVTGSGIYTITIKLLSGLMSGVTATSPCGGTSNVVYSEYQSGPSNNCSFAIVRYWTVTDACHHTAIATQLVVVADTTPPSATCPPDVMFNTDPGVCTFTYTNGTVNFNASTLSVTDNCGGNVFLTNNAPSSLVFPKGTNFVVWTAIDTCGNSASCTEKVIVVDNQAPIMICPGNILTSANNPDGAVVTFAPSATDNCGGSVPVICAHASGSVFGIGTTLVSCTATDSSGNVASCSFNVTVAMDPASFRILCIAVQDDDILLTWLMPLGFTGIVQATSGDGSGGYSNSFSDVSAPIYVPGSGIITTNYLDTGVVTNFPARYYRVRLVP